MADRPRSLYISSDTIFRVNEFRDALTGQLITGIASPTMKIWDDTLNTLLTTVVMTEVAGVPGSYEALVKDTLTISVGFTEGQRLRLIFNLKGSGNTALNFSAKAVARTFTDDGI